MSYAVDVGTDQLFMPLYGSKSNILGNTLHEHIHLLPWAHVLLFKCSFLLFTQLNSQRYRTSEVYIKNNSYASQNSPKTWVYSKSLHKKHYSLVNVNQTLHITRTSNSYYCVLAGGPLSFHLQPAFPFSDSSHLCCVSNARPSLQRAQGRELMLCMQAKHRPRFGCRSTWQQERFCPLHHLQ